MSFRDRGAAEYSIGDSITEFSKSGHRVTGFMSDWSQVTGPSVSGTQPTRTSGTGTGSRITGSQVTPSGDSDTHGSGLGSLGKGSQTVGTSSGRHSSDEDVEEGLRHDASSKKRKASWLRELVKEAEDSEGPPKREVKESKAPERFSIYMALVTILRDTVPTTYEQASVHQVWRDAIMEEYNSIMKNGVWKVVLRPEGKLVVTSK